MLAARVKAEVESIREPGIVVCDKTVLGGLAYNRVRTRAAGRNAVGGDDVVGREYATRTYDLVVLLDRRFGWTADRASDAGRYRRRELQRD